MSPIQFMIFLSIFSTAFCEIWNDTLPALERVVEAMINNSLDPHLEDLLVSQTTLTKDTLTEHVKMMNTLRQIQQDKLHLPKTPDPDIASLISQSIVNAPDQVPYLFQGDIILTSRQMKAVVQSAQEDLVNNTSLHRSKRGGLISDTSLRWTGFPIPYTINTASKVDSTAVQAGVNLWQTLTCVSFQRLNSGTGDFIEFFRGAGCYSNIGRVGGKQKISIGQGCNYPAIVAHEIGHALGFWHEQSRYDSGSYIRILTKNIQNGMAGQFSKESQYNFQTFGYPYDLGSVMHYGSSGFSSNGENTIETIDMNYMGTIGQRVALSFYDVKNINTAYCNNVCTIKLPCLHNGYTDPKNCNVCRCSEPFGGTLCEKAASTTSSCGTIDLIATSQFQTISRSGTAQCNWVIKAIPNRKVLIQVDTFSFTDEDTCVSNYLEIRYGPDIANTGARMCSSGPTGIILSQTNEAVVMFRGRGGRFSLQFRQDPPDFIVTLPTTTPTTTPITTPSTTPSTTAQTTQPAGIATTISTTSQSAGITTTISTTTPTTSKPGPSTGSWSAWTSWSNCSEVCGACGSQQRSRICQGGSCPGNSSESVVCNFNLCPDMSNSLPSRQRQPNDLLISIGSDKCTKTIHFRCSSKSSRMCTRKVSAPCTSTPHTIIESQPSSGQCARCCPSFVSNGQTCVPAPPTTTTGSEPITTTAQATTAAPGGQWNEWAQWSPCSNKCGGCGKIYRLRNCSNPPCNGGSVQQQDCGFDACGGKECCSPYIFTPPNQCVKPGSN